MDEDQKLFAEIQAKYPNLMVSFDSYFKQSLAYKGGNDEISITVTFEVENDSYSKEMPLSDIYTDTVYTCILGKPIAKTETIGEKLNKALVLFSEMKKDENLATANALNKLDNTLFDVHGHLQDVSRNISIFRISLLGIKEGRYFIDAGSKFLIKKVFSPFDIRAVKVYKNGKETQNYQTFRARDISETFDK